MDRDSTVININPSGDNKISLTGKIVGLPTLVTDETGFYQWHEYEVLIENRFLNTVTQKVQESEPTRFFARIPIARGSEPHFVDGSKLQMTGDYIFPDRIEVRSLTRKA